MTQLSLSGFEGLICRDDNLARLPKLDDDSVDLIYLDPPFFSNRQYEVIWNEESEVRSFVDRWKGGIDHYVGWMEPRVREMRRVLKRTGSIYLHCDSHASHYLKVMLDGVFGRESFRNEIIWKRTGSHSSAHRYAPVHDTLLYYTKSRTYTWNPIYEAQSDAYLSRYKYDDGDGQLYYPDNLTALGVRNGSSGKPWRGLDVAAKGNHWKFTIDKLEQLDAEGRIYWPAKPSGWPRYKRYRHELKGRAISDVWTDIDPLNAKAAERIGYPTQKPETLLARIISASTNSGDLVLDPFCGCGTAIAVAHKLQRRWIGIDISLRATNVMSDRMGKLGANFSVENGIETVRDLRDLGPIEFQDFIIERVYGTQNERKTGDMGIDGYSFLEKLPIQIKKRDRVGRNTVDNFETAIRRAGASKGYIMAFSFTKDAHAEAARVRAEGLEIALIDVGSLFEAGRDVVPRATASQLEADLFHAVRMAANDPNRSLLSPPKARRSADELAASAGVG